MLFDAEFRNLDLLRAVAATLVLLSHTLLVMAAAGYIDLASPSIFKMQMHGLGRVGVLMFFVHTALVLLYSLARNENGRWMRNFYIRRVFRIFPLNAVCVLLVLLFKVPYSPPESYISLSWAEIVSNLLLVQNIVGFRDVISPLWTLPREFQMYIVLPFIFLALKRIPSNLFIIVLSLIFLALTPVIPLLSCFPCFMGGVLAYQISKEGTFGLPALVWPAALGLLTVTYVAAGTFVLSDARTDFLTCMFLGGLIPNIKELRPSSLTRASHLVAKYSFGIYLCHDPLLWFSFVKLNASPPALQWLVFITLVTSIPLFAYHFIELPMIQFGHRLTDRLSSDSGVELMLGKSPARC